MEKKQKRIKKIVSFLFTIVFTGIGITFKSPKLVCYHVCTFGLQFKNTSFPLEQFAGDTVQRIHLKLELNCLERIPRGNEENAA